MNKILLIILAILTLSACQSLDSALSDFGSITENTSKFDGTKYLQMNPAISNHGLTGNASFGLYWSNAMGDKARLTAQFDTALNFDPNKPLELKIDDELIILDPVAKRDYGQGAIEGSYRVGYYNSTAKDFIITKEQIRKIVDGNKGVYRIHLLNNETFDGDINYDYRNYQSYMVGAFGKFYDRAWN